MKKRAGSDGSGPLAVLVAACCTAQAAGITLASPNDYQVFQRQSMTHCEIRVAVDVSEAYDAVEALGQEAWRTAVLWQA